MKKCNDSDAKEHSQRRKNVHGRIYKINSAMILTVVFVERNAFLISVKLEWTKDVVMSWCIGQKLGTCTVFTKTTSDVTGWWYCISYL